MSRRLAPIITLFFFVFISCILVPITYAVSTDPPATTAPDPVDSWTELDAEMEKNGKMDKSLQEFCAKRQGNLMNLETWYSGKCPEEGADFDSYSGEGVGFSDIVILDLVERLSGAKNPKLTFSQRLKEIITKIKKISYVTPGEYQLAINEARQKLFFNDNDGLVSGVGNAISLLYKYPPASTGSYLAYVSQNLQRHKIISPALAASTGVGFSTFSPFIELWKVVRNIAYFGLILFFIVYGFMMMFRINLGQKTVITVQLAIPKLIVTLLVITFSYAIVGLIFDFMWVLVYFFIGFLKSQNIIYIVEVAGTKIWSPSYVAYGNSILGFTGSLITNSLVAGPAAVYGILNLILGGTIASIGFIVAQLSPLTYLVYLIILIAVLISYAKLFVKLVGAFIYVVISLITGPILLLGNALPGSQVIGSWIRNIVANLFIFPITMLFLLFSYLFMIQPLVTMCKKDEINVVVSFFGFSETCENLFGVKDLVKASATQNITNIPLITPLKDFGVLGGFNAEGLLALVGVGLLLMAPKYVEMVRDALKVPPFKYGSAIGDALKMGVKYAPMTPGVGDKIGNNKAYTTAAGVFGITPAKGQLGGERQQDTSESKAPIGGNNKPTSETNAWNNNEFGE